MMARLRLVIGRELMAKVLARAEQLWPGEGMRAVVRYVEDTIRRYAQFHNAIHRHRGK